jgi:hypothetical protein
MAGIPALRWGKAKGSMAREAMHQRQKANPRGEMLWFSPRAMIKFPDHIAVEQRAKKYPEAPGLFRMPISMGLPYPATYPLSISVIDQPEIFSLTKGRSGKYTEHISDYIRFDTTGETSACWQYRDRGGA